MNLNKLIINILSKATGMPVSQDEYDGKADKYIIFTYTDERPELFGDNKALADVAYLQIQMITPKSYNYFAMKKVIRDTLEDAGFITQSITSFLGDVYNGTEKIRQTIFEVMYSESR